MPPCQRVLMNKIHRTKILTMIIKNARESSVNIPLKNWWYVNENMEIEYFSGSPYPSNIEEITLNSNSGDDDEEDNDYISDSDESNICDSDDDS